MKSIKDIPLRPTLMSMVILFLGVQLLIVDICSFIRREIKKGSNVWSVRNNTVSIVGLIGMKE